MKKEFLLKSLLAILVLSSIAAVVLQPTVDQEFHELYNDNLASMQSLSTQLALDIFQAQRGYILHYDFIEADLQRLEKSLQLSLLAPSFVTAQFKDQRDEIANLYRSRLDAIRENIDQIKSLIGLVRNSEKRSDAISRKISISSPDSVIMTGLWGYQQMLRNGAPKHKVQAHLEDLQKHESPFYEEISGLIPHAIVLSHYQPILSRLMTETNANLLDNESAITLADAYRIQHAEATKRMQYFLWLVSGIGGLFMLLALSLIAMHYRFRESQIVKTQMKNAELVKALEERDEFSEQASTDPLTGAYNRRAFWRICQQSLDKISDKRQLAIIAIDVNKFKNLNDEYGHSAGDTVLQTIPVRLRGILGSEAIIGRLGGDEFALLAGSGTVQKLHDTVASIYNELHISQLLDGRSINSSASVGAVHVDRNRNLDDLISDADIAMYAGREMGAKQAVWYKQEMREASAELKILSRGLEQALANHEIAQVYQPIINLSSGEIAGYEVLARWNHPERGPVRPDIFIEVAQRNGLINQLDKVMLESSLDVLKDFHQENHRVTMQVNLSGLSITPALPDYIKTQLKNRAIAPEFLTLELTETWIVDNVRETAAIMGELAELGVNLHLDDFGTGFSSLMHLQSFPVNGLKIDRSFVNQVSEEGRSRQLVDATMALAKSLHMEVVAEGIETVEQADYISSLGCDFGQGYLYSKPVSATEAMQMLNSRFRKAA